MVMKGGGSVPDMVRAGRLLDEVNRLGISLNGLEEFVGLANTMASERKLGSSEFVDSALRLRSLEEETGKSYGQVIKDFEEKRSELKKLDGESACLEKEIQGLKEKLTKTEKGLSSTVQRLKSTIETEERLKKLGLEKVTSLAEFIEDFEDLGFNAQEVRKLMVWREFLKKMGINQDGLERFVKEKGPFEKQISELEKERRRVEGIVKELRDEHRRLFQETTSLQADVLKLSKLGKVVKLGKIIIPCKVCGAEGVFVKLHTASEYRGMMSSGSVLQYTCFNCGQLVAYTPGQILTEVGLMAAPEIKEAQTPLAKD